jgi:hypothetical protein
MSSLWPSGQKMDMKKFLADPRLEKWFVQNYDAVGCNAYSCSDLNRNASTDQPLIDKIITFTIGLDLHSHAEKRSRHEQEMKDLLCEQRRELDEIRSTAVSFQQRTLTVVAGFDCKFDNSKIGVGRKRTRGEVCGLLASNCRNGPCVLPVVKLSESAEADNKQRRQQFWAQMSSVSFALAPAGFGTDTHRYCCLFASLLFPWCGARRPPIPFLMDYWSDLQVLGGFDDGYSANHVDFDARSTLFSVSLYYPEELGRFVQTKCVAAV